MPPGGRRSEGWIFERGERGSHDATPKALYIVTFSC